MARLPPVTPPTEKLALHRLPREFLAVIAYGRKAAELVWQTSRAVTVWLGRLTLLLGAVPALIAWLGARIVAAVVAAAASGGALAPVLERVAFEGLAVALLALCMRGQPLATPLLRAQPGS